MTASTCIDIAEKYAAGIWDDKNLDAIEQFLHKNILIHSMLGDFHGHKAMRDVVATWLIAFPDLKVTNRSSVCDNDNVTIQWEAEGTHQGDFKGHKATHKRVFYDGVSLYRVRNDKIVEYWAYLNMQNLLHQLR